MLFHMKINIDTCVHLGKKKKNYVFTKSERDEQEKKIKKIIFLNLFNLDRYTFAEHVNFYIITLLI